MLWVAVDSAFAVTVGAALSSLVAFRLSISPLSFSPDVWLIEDQQTSF
jgi:hypothetical protein